MKKQGMKKHGMKTPGMTTWASFPIGLASATIALFTAAVAPAAGLPVAPPARQDRVRFQDEVMPMLAANCTACHNQKVREGGLSMDSLERILAGGDSGASIIAGKPAESLLFLRAAHRQEDFMPPGGNSVGAKNLAPEQLGLLERWITEGAQGSSVAAKPIHWRPLAKGTGGVIAAALSADGRLAAAARAGRMSLFDTRTALLAVSLVDPALAGLAPELAHADVVTAAAFSPTEDLLATGSFRTIKLWRRAGPRKLADLPDSTGVTLLAVAPAGGFVVLGLADGRLGLVDMAAGGPPAVRVIGVPGAVATAAAVSADGATLFVAAKDNVVTAWRLGDGVAVGRLARPAGVGSLAVVSGGTRLVTAEPDGMLRVWELPLPEAAADPSAAKPLKEIAGAPQPVVGLVEMPAVSGHVLGGCGDGIARLWNLENAGVVRQFPHGGAMSAIALTADGSRLATVGTLPGVKLWNAADGKLVAHSSGDFRIADRLVRKDADVTVLKQDVEHAKAEVAAAEKAKGTAAEEVKKAGEKLAAAEKTLAEKDAAAKTAKTAREEADKLVAAAMAAVPQAEAMIETATKSIASATAGVEGAATAAAAFAKAAEGNTEAAEAQKAAQAASQAAVAAKAAAEQAAAQAKTVLEKAKAKAADLTTKAAEKMKAEKDADDALSKARTGVETAKRDGEFAAADVKRAEEALPTRQAALAAIEGRLKAAEAERVVIDGERNASARPFAAATFSRDGTALHCLDATGGVVVHGAQDGQPRSVFPVPAQATAIVALGGGRLVVGGGPAPASLHDVTERWDLVRTIGGESTPPAADDDPAGPPIDAVLSLAFSPDGSLLASGSGRASRSGEIKLWKTADGSLVRSIPQPHSDTVVSLAFSRTGDRLASGGTDRFAKVHTIADGKTERSLEGHTSHVLGVAWQAHGRRLVTAGADKVVKVWDVASGEQQRTIQGPGHEVTGVQFIGEGDEIVAASGDATVRVFNAASGAAVRQLNGAGDFVQTLAIAGPTVAAGSQDGRLRIWNVATPEPLHSVEPSPAP